MAEVASSGNEVPRATIVTPMTDSGTPHDCAIDTALLTISSPPIISPVNPKIINNIAFQIGAAMYVSSFELVLLRNP